MQGKSRKEKSPLMITKMKTKLEEAHGRVGTVKKQKKKKKRR